jgi:hypothetical protein
LFLSDLELIQLQAEALFVHDTNGRLLRINETDNDNPPPRLFLSRTKSGNLCRTRYDLPPDLAAELEHLAASEPIISDHAQEPRYLAEYIELLKPHHPVTKIDSGPSYYVPESDQSHTAVPITSENINLTRTYFSWLLTTLADYAPVMAAVVDGNAAAVCFCSRRTPQVAEAGIYTEELFRGHGYATQTAIGWAAAVRSTGRQPLYSTSWTNHASQAIARKLGGVMYGSDYSIS